MDSSSSARRRFEVAVRELTSFAPAHASPLGGNLAVAVAVLLHRASPERFQIPVAGDGVTTSDLALKVCDPSWSKDSAFLPRGAEGPIYKPFTTSFKGVSSGTNNWRNSFDIQGGIGCSAPYTASHLQSSVFIDEHRFDCSFREDTQGICMASGVRAHCFNPNKNGAGVPAWSDTSAKPRPKLLRRVRRDNGSFEYWSVEPTVASLSTLLGHPEHRVPAATFATALFTGSPYWAKWSEDHSADRLQRELALDDEMFFTLFSNRELARGSAGSEVVSGEPTAPGWGAEEPSEVGEPFKITSGLAGPVDYRDQNVNVTIQFAGTVPDPEKRRRLLEKATQGHRRVLNRLAMYLRAQGFTVDEQPGGYDLRAADGGQRHILFEAKTWTSSNLASQVRSGWAQLEEYAFRNRTIVGNSPELVLVLNSKPPADFWAWEWFKSRNAPRVVWLTTDGIATFEHDADWLDGLTA